MSSAACRSMPTTPRRGTRWRRAALSGAQVRRSAAAPCAPSAVGAPPAPRASVEQLARRDRLGQHHLRDHGPLQLGRAEAVRRLRAHQVQEPRPSVRSRTADHRWLPAGVREQRRLQQGEDPAGVLGRLQVHGRRRASTLAGSTATSRTPSPRAPAGLLEHRRQPCSGTETSFSIVGDWHSAPSASTPTSARSTPRRRTDSRTASSSTTRPSRRPPASASSSEAPILACARLRMSGGRRARAQRAAFCSGSSRSGR